MYLNLRLVPDRWSAAFNNLGYRDREAYVRIAPIQENSPDAAAQFNLEYRAADAVASPYLVLGSLIYAGLQGLNEELPVPTVTVGDPRNLSDQERARAGISWLPRALSDALDALEADAIAKAWFPPALLDAFFRYKRDEVATMRDIPSDEQCIRYAGAY